MASLRSVGGRIFKNRFHQSTEKSDEDDGEDKDEDGAKNDNGGD